MTRIIPFLLERVTNKQGCVDTSSCYTIKFNNSIANLRFSILNISPNPNDGHFQLRGLSVLNPSQFSLKIQIFDTAGQQVHEQSINHTADNEIFMNLPEGIYFLQLAHKDGIIKQKLVIEHL